MSNLAKFNRILAFALSVIYLSTVAMMFLITHVANIYDMSIPVEIVAVSFSFLIVTSVFNMALYIEGT